MDPVGPVTSEGKLRCDYCRRSFDTRSEKNLHIARRHADLAAESAKAKANDDSKDSSNNAKSINNKQKGVNKGKAGNTDKIDNNRTTPTPSSRTKPKNKSTTKPSTKSVNKPKDRRKNKPTTNTRRYRCQVCERVFEMQSELNHHFRKRHPPVQCEICKKSCATPNTLDRHMYKHKTRNQKCRYCEQSFAFKSELHGHMIVHQGESGFFCEDCDKSFKRYQELVAHEKTHTGEIHRCTETDCDYKAKDIRYLKIHMKTTHAREENYLYQCEICEERFKFFEQRKRHYNNDH